MKELVVEYRAAEYTCTERRYGVETTNFKDTFAHLVSLARDATVRAASTPVRDGRTGDTAEQHRLLDQRYAHLKKHKNCRSNLWNCYE